MKQPVFGSKRSAVRRLLAFVTTACCVLSSAYSQPGGYSSQDKRAIKLYESGSTCMQQRKWACARGEFTKAAEADARFVEPRLMLAEMAEQEGKDEEAITRYREVVSISPRFFPTAQLHLADLEFKGGRYAEAEQSYKAFLAMEQDPVRKSRAKLGLENCAFAARAILQPVPFEPKNMGPSINSPDPEYYPCLTADDGTLIYTRRVKAPEIPVYGMQEDFYISRRGPDGQWQQSRTIPTVSDPGYNEGAGTLTPDGRFIIYTQCALEDGLYAGKARGLADHRCVYAVVCVFTGNDLIIVFSNCNEPFPGRNGSRSSRVEQHLPFLRYHANNRSFWIEEKCIGIRFPCECRFFFEIHFISAKIQKLRVDNGQTRLAAGLHHDAGNDFRRKDHLHLVLADHAADIC